MNSQVTLYFMYVDLVNREEELHYKLNASNCKILNLIILSNYITSDLVQK